MEALSKDTPIFVAGHAGLMGSAILRRLGAEGYSNLLTAGRSELDLRIGADVEEWLHEHQPRFVFLVAGLGGGILANQTRPADFLFDNLRIHTSVLQGALAVGSIRKLLYISPSTVYPRHATQPIVETELLTGPLELSNRPYALAKIAGIEMCETVRRQFGRNFVAAVSTNIYGPGDDFDLATGNVIPALIRKLHDAKAAGDTSVPVWGTGSPLRDFMHVDDLADAALFLMQRYDSHGHINVGTGNEISIRNLAEKLRDLIYPSVELTFDHDRPDGSPRMLLDTGKITRLGWSPSIELDDGLRSTLEWFRANESAS